MGKIICPIHGDSGLSLVCSHLRSSVLAGSPVGEYQKWECYVGKSSMPQLCCTECLDLLYAAGLPPSGFVCTSDQDDEMLERIFETVGGQAEPVCNRCLTSAIGAQV